MYKKHWQKLVTFWRHVIVTLETFFQPFSSSCCVFYSVQHVTQCTVLDFVYELCVKLQLWEKFRCCGWAVRQRLIPLFFSVWLIFFFSSSTSTTTTPPALAAAAVAGSHRRQRTSRWQGKSTQLRPAAASSAPQQSVILSFIADFLVFGFFFSVLCFSEGERRHLTFLPQKATPFCLHQPQARLIGYISLKLRNSLFFPENIKQFAFLVEWLNNLLIALFL